MAQTDYGVILGKFDSASVYTTIGEVVSIDPPEYTQPELESTSHASGGVRKYISSKLAEMTPFKVTINYAKANIAALATDMLAGTIGRYSVAFDSLNAELFGALVTSIKPLPADAQSPGVLKADITFRPTDSISLSS